MEKNLLSRKDVDKKNCWQVETMYATEEAWDEQFAKVDAEGWSQLKKELVILEDPASLALFLDQLMKTECMLETLYTYAHLRHDEDVGEEKAKERYSKAVGLLHRFEEDLSWLAPSILRLSKETVDTLLADKNLSVYRVFLTKIIRMQKYTLSEKEEEILAGAAKALESSAKAFGALNNADLQFMPCKDSSGKSHELTHGSYSVYLKSFDRVLRKEAFENLHGAFGNHANTLCELLEGVIQKHVFYQKTRGYSSSLEAALYPKQVPQEVYHALIKGVKEKISYLHEYNEFRRAKLGLSSMYSYDLQVSLVDDFSLSFTYEEASHLIVESVACMGEEYQEILQKGLLEEGWVDRYENQRKRSGAYSSGCYTSKPYILMNYQGTLQDVKTLAHEAGHSMHSYFSAKNQPYQDYQYPIFLAEVASTFHEELLFQHLYKRGSSAKEKGYLINQKIEGIRSTLFRQVLFAEFELQVHQWVEEGRPLTPQLLQKYYGNLVQEYGGSALTIDPYVCHEWSRIPHFYYNFYVYQYATGISAAQVLAKNVLEGKEGAVSKVLQFLSMGGSLDPISTLQLAGVDVTNCKVVECMLEDFRCLVEDLKGLI